MILQVLMEGSTSGAIVNATTVSGGNSALYDLATDKITVNQNGSIIEVFGNLYFISDIDDVEITLHHTNTSYPANVPSGYVLYSGQTYSIISAGFGDITLDAGEQCWMQIKGIGGSVSIDTSTNNSWLGWHVSNDANTIINDTMLGFRGDTSQWEFFKGFIDMFKLVILVDENNPTNLLIEPYADWVGAGNELDWTNKIDKDEFLYTPIRWFS